ncbi:MAG TPA: AAA family ATPase [Acidimicrobiales bacterium]|nr:AAA family ATPase [Acidimicrobiales bacterium]
MARGVLSDLGRSPGELLQSDRTGIWIAPSAPVEVDLDQQEAKIRAALALPAGLDRDDLLCSSLAEEGVLLADEPYAEWVLAPRERLEDLRQQARLELARDRGRGAGRASTGAVTEAWEHCLAHDPGSEEAATALMRGYASQGQRQLVVRTYERCRAGLEQLGLVPSPSLDDLYAKASSGPAARVAGQPAHAEDHYPAARPPVGVREERKVVTVLCAEVPVAALEVPADPEDLRELIGECLAKVIVEVEALGGTVTAVSGGRLEALFGAPEAHEDDPERALRAAYRAVVAARDGQAGATHQPCLGIESGLAVVGAVGAGRSLGYGATGAVVGTAGVLASRARPGSVLVGPATHAAAGALFQWGPPQEVPVGNEVKPLVAHYLERPNARAPGRPLRLGGKGKLVGRGTELSLLEGALRDAEGGAGSVVSIVGEPGLGKTRLVQECRKRFMAWVGAERGRLPLWLEARCASYASTTPYGLFQHLVASWAGVAVDQGEAVVVPALERAIVATMGNSDRVGVLTRMLGLAPRGPTATMSPEVLQRATFSAVRALISRLTSFGPVVVALEDLHWADATSLRLTEEVATMAAGSPLVVVLTHRPAPDRGLVTLEETVAGSLGPKWHKLELAPLGPLEERDLARSLVGERVSAAVLELVREGAEGNPLFLEEKLFSLLEAGALLRDRGDWRVVDATLGGVPQVLDRLVRSRADRLTPVTREVSCAASVLGQEFPISYLRYVCDNIGTLDASMVELSNAGLVEFVEGAAEPTYRFRHALVQEAIYQGLLRSERRRLHGRAAWALETVFQDRAAEAAALLSRHFAAAGEGERAFAYYELAGDHAAAAFANEEAVSSYRSALGLVEAGAVDLAVPSRAVPELRAKLADVLLRGLGRTGEAREQLQAALYDCHGDPFESARTQVRLGRLEDHDNRADDALAAFGVAEKLLGGPRAGGSEAWAAAWLDLMLDGRASVYIRQLRLELAGDTLAAALPVLRAHGNASHWCQYYCAVASLGAVGKRWQVDEEDVLNMRRAVTEAGRAGDNYREGYMVDVLGWMLLCRGDLSGAEEAQEHASKIASRTGDPFLRCENSSRRSVAALRRHDVRAVRSFCEQAVLASDDLGYHPEFAGWARACLPWLAWREGRVDDVLCLADEVTELMLAARRGHAPNIVPSAWWGFLEFQWVFLWPVLAVNLKLGDAASAVEAARRMLDPRQQRPQPELEVALERAVETWDGGNAGAAKELLAQALELAERLGYF